ncbi:MFS transporter [Kangiella sediminilitoris]|uniref:Major facilitator superfamily permease n=1 Tax=Kangiella sediminilitoris TaxID=1144748 RepID=A0A1B3B8N3_9GAMM|nr:MFS transporter permease [Kangiella sediminilitoris]AOE49130.1 Major facilitator superfamily permease [Kangiella sediminilitoris]
MSKQSTVEQVYEAINSGDDGRVCKDIPEQACDHQPKNVTTHIVSLASTKVADGLIDPKLILSWLLSTLGASTFLVGLLVPIREAGALLPQLFTAGALRQLPQRKWAWALGSLVQGISVVGMVLSALFMEGTSAGISILVLLGVLAIARSVCSVSYKDVLGKTVSKSMRGKVTGMAASIASAAVILFGVALASGFFERMDIVLIALGLAATLWIFASIMFTQLEETPGSTEGGGNPLTVAKENLTLLIKDRQLVRFIIVRALLIATALAPPFMVTLNGSDDLSKLDSILGGLGALVLASALASFLSSYVWGWLADKSSRKVLLLSSFVAMLALGATALLGQLELIGQGLLLPALLFVLMIAYHGVRLGRSTHLVDMATAENRAAYTALSNTIIGIILLTGVGFSAIAQYFGNVAVLAVMAVMCLLAGILATGLREVQQVP